MDFETRLAMEWESEIQKYRLACQHLLKEFTFALNAWVKTALEQMPADWRASWAAFVQAWSDEGVELKDHWKRDFAAWLEFYEREAQKTQARLKAQPSRSAATARREAPAHLPDPYDPIDARRFSKESLVAEVDWIRRVGPFAGLLRHLRSSRARQFVTIDDRHRLHLDGLRIIEREQARLVLTAGETKELDQYLTDLMFTLDSPSWPPTVPESWSKKDRLAWQAVQDSPPEQRTTERDKWSEVFRSTRLRAAEVRLANQLKVTPEWEGNQYLWVFFDDRGTFVRIHVGDFRDGGIHIGEAFGGYVLRSDWWDARGEDVLRGEANLFVRYVLEPTEGPIRRDELLNLVAQYLRSGGSAPLKKAMEDEQRRLDRQGYWSPAPETPEFTEWQRQLAQSASDRWFDAMLKQGHSQAYAYAALVFAPAGVNPNEANFDNILGVLGTGTALRPTRSKVVLSQPARRYSKERVLHALQAKLAGGRNISIPPLDAVPAAGRSKLARKSIVSSTMTKLDFDSDWRQQGRSNGLRRTDAIVYVVRDASTSEVLKVGETGFWEKRFGEYLRRARIESRRIEIITFKIGSERKTDRVAIERQIRLEYMREGNALRWDDTVIGKQHY